MAYAINGIESKMINKNDNVDLSENCDFVPPINMIQDFLMREKVGKTTVTLDGEVSWYEEGNTMAPFYYNERYSEEFKADALSSIVLRNGVSWDSITPILHPALAGLEIGAAGIDEAFTKSMGALETLIQGRKTEMSAGSRQFMKDMLRRNIHPAALLTRLSIMWITANLTAGSNGIPVTWQVQRDVNEPMRMDTVTALDGYLSYVNVNHNDTIYIAIEHISEAYMLDVLYAACAETCPIISETRWRASQFWPAMQKPRVTYMAPNTMRRPQMPFTASQIMDTTQRMCEILDCHNMFKEVLSGMQAFCVKPETAGCFGGHNAMVVHMPRSDMKAACLGPLYAGISPQGMKTAAFLPPKFKKFLYGAAVKSTFMGCVLYEYASKLTSAHPVAIALRVASGHSLRPLTTCEGAYNFWHNMQDRLLEVGWGCVNRFSAGMAAVDVNTALHKLMDPASVVWWLAIAKHMKIETVKELQNWMRPAQMTSVPRSRRWYAVKKENGVSEEQIAVALRHMQAEVGYLVDLGNDVARMLPVVSQDNTRFIAPVATYIQSDEFSAQAKFIMRRSNPHEMYNFLRSMSVCTAHLLDVTNQDGPMFTEDEATSTEYEALDPDVIMSAPFVSAAELTGVRGPTPKTEKKPEGYEVVPEPKKSDAEDTFNYGIHGVFTPMVDACNKLTAKGLIAHLDNVETAMQDVGMLRAVGARPRIYTYIINAASDMEVYDTLSRLQAAERLSAAEDIASFLNQAINFAQSEDLPAIKSNYDNAVAIIQALKVDPTLNLEEVEGTSAIKRRDQRLSLSTIGKMSVRSGHSFTEAVKKSMARGKRTVNLVQLAESMPSMPDDPVAKTESAQVFGKDKSPPGSNPQTTKKPSAVKSVAESSTSSAEKIGFAPPAPSEISEEPLTRWADIVQQLEESGQAEEQ
ncbi:hypothetical protein MMARV_C005P1 [viral metagenome]|uniref:Uncharacterized protein n=1 Tax=viral metagenome TaxID=1070528 RepID=A0A6L2ZKG8_9ZZZZ